MAIADMPPNFRESCRQSNIGAKSILLEIVRQSRFFAHGFHKCELISFG
jgi:hypothetical protein